MADQKLLAVFDVQIKDSLTRFSIYGEYEIQQETYCGIDYKYPEFYDLIARKVDDKEEIEFHPIGNTWAGRKFVVEDMINGFLACLIQNGQLYTKVYLVEGLQELVDFYLSDDRKAITVKDLDIPKWILHNDMYQLFSLALVTDSFIYYMYEDEFLMFRTSNHELVSDNYFASVGFYESVNHIHNADGMENLIWGEIPTEQK